MISKRLLARVLCPWQEFACTSLIRYKAHKSPTGIRNLSLKGAIYRGYKQTLFVVFIDDEGKFDECQANSFCGFLY